MKNNNKISYLMLSLILILSLIFVGCSDKNIENNNSAQIANPASKYCIEQGHNITIRTNPDGSQTGYCLFDNGNECEEWAYMRGECEE
jgi:putative hemolysin